MISSLFKWAFIGNHPTDLDSTVGQADLLTGD
jgi:hypothetical protein